jgi:SAM-dependent methyltransferase
MPREPHRPFADAAVVDRYEEWYATPYGRVADELEVGLLLELLRPLPAGATVLDLGCGTGHFARALAERGYRVTGVDPERAMLGVARERLPVVCGDGQRLPFADGAFAATVVIAVLQYAADPVALLREARRVSRKRVVVLAVVGPSWLGWRRRLSGWLGHPIFSAARFQSRAQLRALARASGAEPEDLRTLLFLPPALAGRLPHLERWLSRGTRRGGGLLGFTLPGAGSPAPRS